MRLFGPSKSELISERDYWKKVALYRQESLAILYRQADELYSELQATYAIIELMSNLSKKGKKK